MAFRSRKAGSAEVTPKAGHIMLITTAGRQRGIDQPSRARHRTVPCQPLLLPIPIGPHPPSPTLLRSHQVLIQIYLFPLDGKSAGRPKVAPTLLTIIHERQPGMILVVHNLCPCLDHRSMATLVHFHRDGKCVLPQLAEFILLTTTLERRLGTTRGCLPTWMIMRPSTNVITDAKWFISGVNPR